MRDDPSREPLRPLTLLSSSIVRPLATSRSSVSQRFESDSKLNVARSVSFGLMASNWGLMTCTAAGRNEHCVKFEAGTAEHV